MKTDLNIKIETIQQAKKFLFTLLAYNEIYHPQDDAFDVSFNCEVSDMERQRLNDLMADVNSLEGFDAFAYIKSLEIDLTKPVVYEGSDIVYKVIGYNDDNYKCKIEPMTIEEGVSCVFDVCIFDLENAFNI